MREQLECAFLFDPHHHDDPLAAVDVQMLVMQRVAWSPVRLEAPEASEQAPSPQLLARLATALMRFDVCVLAVTPATLGWARTALAAARSTLRTPVVGYTRDLRAVGLQDLFDLGMADFVTAPFSLDELRMRWQRLPRDIGGAFNAANGIGHGAAKGIGIAQPVASGIGEPPRAYGGAAGAPRALPTLMGAGSFGGSQEGAPAPLHARVRVSSSDFDATLRALSQAPQVRDDEPFRQAKSRVVAQFEQDYLRLALSRHAGNVARAARASDKHRRAFWALMRKHGIDAATFRRDTADDAFTVRAGRSLASRQ